MSTLAGWKRIAVVPSAKDFVDVILSKTQRKTPTVIHRHYKIGRIRAFYMRKVKYTQQNFHDKLTLILTDFPKVEVTAYFMPMNSMISGIIIHRLRTCSSNGAFGCKLMLYRVVIVSCPNFELKSTIW